MINHYDHGRRGSKVDVSESPEDGHFNHIHDFADFPLLLGSIQAAISTSSPFHVDASWVIYVRDKVAALRAYRPLASCQQNLGYGGTRNSFTEDNHVMLCSTGP